MKLRSVLKLSMMSCLATVAGCVGWSGPSVLRTGSSEELAVEALHTARTDFASGQPRICYAGTYASSAVGIPYEELGRVSHLKEWPLPSGCTEPLAHRSIRFARIYNEEILRLLDRICD